MLRRDLARQTVAAILTGRSRSDHPFKAAGGKISARHLRKIVMISGKPRASRKVRSRDDAAPRFCAKSFDEMGHARADPITATPSGALLDYRDGR